MSEIIFGRNAIIEAIKQKRKFEKLFITDGNKDIVKLAKDNNLKYEIDIYPFWKETAILEIELEDEKQE